MSQAERQEIAMLKEALRWAAEGVFRPMEINQRDAQILLQTRLRSINKQLLRKLRRLAYIGGEPLTVNKREAAQLHDAFADEPETEE